MSPWVKPLRITTPEGDTIHGAIWPDGRIFAWDPGSGIAEAYDSVTTFEAETAANGETVEWWDE